MQCFENGIPIKTKNREQGASKVQQTETKPKHLDAEATIVVGIKPTFVVGTMPTIAVFPK